MGIEIFKADYTNEKHSIEVGELLDCYARDPMGGAAPLDPHVKAKLASTLAKVPHAFSLICYVDGEPAALTNCFEGFSTFQCKPLINIHDFVVKSEFRGQGLSQKLLAKIEDIAREKDCCKITLEVLDNNQVARNSYLKFGFDGYELDPSAGKALFWQKKLS